MKKILIFSVLSLFLITSCRKDDNVRVPDLAKVPMPLLKKDASVDQIISAQDPNAFSGKFSVGLQFPDADKPSKFDIVVRKNENKDKVKTFKTDVTTFPVSVAITGAQIKELFGEEIVLGDKYDFGVDITTADGTKYLAFPPVGASYGANVAAIAGSSVMVRYEAVCKFTMTDYGAIGSTVPFIVVSDEWNDYAPNTQVSVNIIDETHLSFTYATADNVKPIVVTINPVNNSTSVTKVAYGDYGDGLIFSAASVASSLDNNVAPCDLTVSVRLNHTSSRGNYGDYTIVLKKK